MFLFSVAKNLFQQPVNGTPDEQYNNFVTGQVFLPGSNYPTTGYPILQKGNGKASNIILALSGLPPFDGSTFYQMPVNGPYLDQETIDAISAWIDAGRISSGTQAWGLCSALLHLIVVGGLLHLQSEVERDRD
jgi:hypothetical protein